MSVWNPGDVRVPASRSDCGEDLGKRLRLNREKSKDRAEQEAGKFRRDLGKTKH